MSETNDKICVIACGMLGADLKKAAERTGIKADFEILPAGLHETPAQLRILIQQIINTVSNNGYGRIVIGYGVCGQGTAGIRAGKLPLVIPQVHDCISLFLGSDSAYKEQFKTCPGTYYFTAGWFSPNAEPGEHRNFPIGLNPAQNRSLSYSKEESELIADFFSGWQKNYTRAVFINTSDEQGKKVEEYAKTTAEKFGWKYEEITGNPRLFEKMLTTDKNDDEILIVPPGFKIVFDPQAGKLEAIRA
ncbi:MAG: DUF1638 domain-containing protein [Phycisphaerae bacterium]|nr:DUF1638 domain-containing protein [Phycisphaerae bacterium]